VFIWFFLSVPDNKISYSLTTEHWHWDGVHNQTRQLSIGCMAYSLLMGCTQLDVPRKISCSDSMGFHYVNYCSIICIIVGGMRYSRDRYNVAALMSRIFTPIMIISDIIRFNIIPSPLCIQCPQSITRHHWLGMCKSNPSDPSVSQTSTALTRFSDVQLKKATKSPYTCIEQYQLALVLGVVLRLCCSHRTQSCTCYLFLRTSRS